MIVPLMSFDPKNTYIFVLYPVLSKERGFEDILPYFASFRVQKMLFVMVSYLGCNGNPILTQYGR